MTLTPDQARKIAEIAGWTNDINGTGSSTIVGTRFWGGEKNGVMLQLTPSESEPYVQLTREDATLLTLLLLQWSASPMREPMIEYGGEQP